jgi:thiamine-phosphate pyrophosphorylase
MSGNLTRIAKELNLQTSARLRLSAKKYPALLLMTDDQRLPDPIPAIHNLPAESGVIFRHYDDPHKESLCITLRALTKNLGHQFFVAEDVDLAVQVAADGCHLPEHLSARAQNIRQAHPEWFLTAAVHSQAAHEAADECLDAILASPVFATKSHASAVPLGVPKLTSWIKAKDRPTYGLGGITDRNAENLKDSGLIGLAGVSGFV